MTAQNLQINIEANTRGKSEVDALIDRLAKAGVDIAPFREEASKLDAEFKQLAQQQALINSFAQTKSATVDAKEAMDTAQQKAQELAKSLKATEAANKDAKASFDAAKSAVQGFAEPLAEAKSKVSQLAETFQKSQSETQSLKDQLALVRVEIKNLAAPSEEVKNKFEQLSGELKASETSTKAAKDALAAAKAEVKNLSNEMSAAQTNVKNAATALKAGEAAAKEQSTAFAAARTAVKDTSAEYQASVGKLQDLRQGLSSAGISTKDLSSAQATLKQKINENAGELGNLQAKMQTATTSQRGLAEQTKQTASTFDSVTDKIKSVNGALAGLVGVAGIKSVTDLADAYQNLQARVKLATGEGNQFESAFAGVFDVAKRTNSVVADTGTLFTKIYDAGKVLNESQKEQIALAEKMGKSQAEIKAITDQMVMSQGEALKLTETINQTVQLSGSSAEASSAAIIQLIQGLQSGVLRGEEFNSVMEQAPRLARALADGLGVGVGELRNMAEQGQLTSQTIIKALENQSAAVATEFSKLPPTVGRAMQNLQTNFTQYVGEVDKAGGYTKNLAVIIDWLAGNLNTIAGVMTHVGEVILAVKLKNMAADWLANDTASRAAAQGIGTATVATTANTTATTANTAAHTTNAAAVSNVGKAANTTTGFLGAMGGAAGSLLRSFAPLLALDIALHFKEYVTAIGEGVAKMMGWKDANKMVADEEKRLAAQLEEASSAKRKNAAAAQEAADRAMGLSKEARKLVTDFDEARKSGDSVTEALKKIGKGFDLSTISGIANASAVLDKLARDGKASADQIQAAWSDALKGVDLKIFEINFRASMGVMQAEADKAAKKVQEAIESGMDQTSPEFKKLEKASEEATAAARHHAERLNDMVGTVLQESLKRTGLDTELLATGMGKAAKSALNDTEILINGLDDLKSKGVDTGQALVASLSKGIDTADSVKAIDAVKVQIQAVRKELGNPMADDLLAKAARRADELNDKLTMLKPGFDDLGRAAKQAGLDIDELTGGASKKFNDSVIAIGNVVRELQKVGNVSESAKRQIEQALDQRLAAAKTTEEIKLVEQAFKKAGDAGTISGKAMADGLQKAKDKADQLTPGINSVREAYAKLGVQAPEDMKKSADEMGKAWDKVKKDGNASAETLKKAFQTYAQAALAAAGSVGSDSWQVKAALLEEQAVLHGLGVSWGANGEAGVKTQQEIQAEIARTNAELAAQQEQIEKNASAAANMSKGGATGKDGPFASDTPTFTTQAEADEWLKQSTAKISASDPYGHVQQQWLQLAYQKGIKAMQDAKAMDSARTGATPAATVPSAPAPAPAPVQPTYPTPSPTTAPVPSPTPTPTTTTKGYDPAYDPLTGNNLSVEQQNQAERERNAAAIKAWEADNVKRKADEKAIADAEQIRKQVEFKNLMDAYQKSLTNPQTTSKPDQTINVVLTTPSGKKQLIPTSQSGADALIAALRDSKLTAGY